MRCRGERVLRAATAVVARRDLLPISKDIRSGYSRDGVELVSAEADALRDGVRRVLAGESVYAITKCWQASVPYGT